MAEKYRSVARIEKTHGRKGEVVARPAHGLPPLLKEGMSVALLPPDLKGPRWREIVSCHEMHDAQLVGFEGLSDLSGSTSLVGKSVLVRERDLPDNFELLDAEALLERRVTDERMGFLGRIEEVLRGPAQDVWVVRGPYGEVLIPAVEPIVVMLGDEVQVDLPPGLVDIPDE